MMKILIQFKKKERLKRFILFSKVWYKSKFYVNSLLILLLAMLFFACDENTEESTSLTLTFTKLTTGKRSISTEDILKQVQGAKEGYTLKSITLSNDSFGDVEGTKPNFTLKVKKVGTFTATIVLEKEGYSDVSLNATFIVTQYIVFDKIFNKSDKDQATSIVQITDGSFVVAGKTYTASRDDFWILKLDSNGNKLWDKTFGKDSYDKAESIVQTSDGGFAVAGYTSNKISRDLWVLKLDSSGNKIWDKTFGEESESDFANSIVQTSDGGFAVAGYTGNKGTNGDLWVLKLDSSGNKIWDKNFGGSNADEAESIVQTSDGGFAVAGHNKNNGVIFWVLKLDKNGNKLWDKDFGSGGAKSIIQTSDGGFAVVGTIEGKVANTEDFRVLKLDSKGNKIWDKTFGEKNNADLAESIVQTSDGGFAFVGYTYVIKPVVKTDLKLFKLDSNGNKLWMKPLGKMVPGSIIQTSDGGFAIAGFKYEEGMGNSIRVLKLDKNGNL